jgi:transcriptional/translational regulatory protein YebC/TACO1
MMEVVLEVDAEDLLASEPVYEIRSAPDQFHRVAKALEDKGVVFAEAKLAWIPSNTVEVADADKAASVLRLMQDLEDHDDVQAVSANYDIPDALMSEIGG